MIQKRIFTIIICLIITTLFLPSKEMIPFQHNSISKTKAIDGGSRHTLMAGESSTLIEKSVFGFGVCYAIFPQEEITFIGAGRLFLAFDTKKKSQPEIIKELVLPHMIYDIHIENSLAYIACSQAGLIIVDISKPHQMKEIGHFPTLASYGNGSLNVEVLGEYAYIADTDSLVIINISNSSEPYLVKRIEMDDFTQGVFVANNHAYVAVYNAGVKIVDITDPANAYIKSGYDTDDRADGIWVDGDYAYVADGLTGLLILDISDPENPIKVSTHHTDDWADGIFKNGNLVYLACGEDGLNIFNVSDPANPQRVGHFPTVEFTGRVKVEGSHAYLASDDYLYIVDISNPALPVLAGTYQSPLYYCYSIVLDSKYAYVTNAPHGLRIIDTSNKTKIKISGVDTPDIPFRLYKKENLVYIADSQSGLQIIDVSKPRNPTIIGSHDTPGIARGVFVYENIAYVADREGGLQIIDVSDPTNTKALGSLALQGSVYDVVVQNNIAYCASLRGGLRIVNVSDPGNPIELGFEETPSMAFEIDIRGMIVYVVDYYTGAHAIDVTDPENPVHIDHYYTDDYPRSIAVSTTGTDVYLGTKHHLTVLDADLKLKDQFNTSDPWGISQYNNTIGLSSLFVGISFLEIK